MPQCDRGGQPLLQRGVRQDLRRACSRAAEGSAVRSSRRRSRWSCCWRGCSPTCCDRFRKGFRFGDGPALAVVRPGSLLEQWRVLKLCAAAGKIVIVQASNTGLTGGSTPDGDQYDREIVIISTLRLEKIHLLDRGRQVVCLPGATLFQLEKQLQPLGRNPRSVIGSLHRGIRLRRHLQQLGRRPDSSRPRVYADDLVCPDRRAGERGADQSSGNSAGHGAGADAHKAREWGLCRDGYPPGCRAGLLRSRLPAARP